MARDLADGAFLRGCFRGGDFAKFVCVCQALLGAENILLT